ncbi:MAG: alpha-galactosidase, partial [Ginsengibacter sp.]
QMGIEIFVIDAGWFEKTGDWEPSKTRFPNKLKDIKKLLDKYKMKLGLWFDPTAAAISSNMLAKNRDCVKTWDGKEDKPNKIWETEESYRMCLVSKYRDDFADELIRIAKATGVTYFKWDAISQYGCNDSHHFHGNKNNTPEERAESFSFELEKSMRYVVDKLCAAVPGAIVDFDITEGERAVGLGFLASGKYFLVNNGPYYFNYDIPFGRENGQWNIFFYPGPARAWICRTPLTFDKWIPSVLFLTHYLPDDPYENQSLAIGSLILGQNGIWGDLPSISKEGIDFFGETLGKYKKIRNDITEATMIRNGAVGGSPEVYEKINPLTGKGTVVVFSSHTGTYHYITKNFPDKSEWATRGTDVSFDKKGHAVLSLKFEKSEAKIVFFGVKNN